MTTQSTNAKKESEHMLVFHVIPEASGRVPQHHGGVQFELVVLSLGGGTPARVRDDHRVGERAESVAHDRHLHSVA